MVYKKPTLQSETNIGLGKRVENDLVSLLPAKYGSSNYRKQQRQFKAESLHL
jgi:hypothetical protein